MKVVKIATIVFSIVCPLIPLIVLVCSVASAKYSASQISKEDLNPVSTVHPYYQLSHEFS